MKTANQTMDAERWEKEQREIRRHPAVEWDGHVDREIAALAGVVEGVLLLHKRARLTFHDEAARYIEAPTVQDTAFLPFSRLQGLG